MDGLKLACLYSYGCTRATGLGVNDQLLRYIKKRDFDVSPIIKKLFSFPRYQMISQMIGSDDCFNERVLRVYWLGDGRDNLPYIFFTHNFSTLAKFRDINSDEHLPALILYEMLDCAVSFGRILAIDDANKRARVVNQRLLYQSGKVVWGEKVRKVSTIFIKNPKKGDIVSIHLAIAREKISRRQAETLKNITLETLKTLKIA